MTVEIVRLEKITLSIESDIWGVTHIKLHPAHDEPFDLIQLFYHAPYTDNASNARLAERIVGLLEGRFDGLLEALKDAYPHIADDATRSRIGSAIAKAEGIAP